MFATPLGLDTRDLPAFAAELLQVVPARHSPMARAEDSLVAAVHVRLLSAVRAPDLVDGLRLCCMSVVSKTSKRKAFGAPHNP